jgi:WS/DGAT/MGAT family acyltransferase
MEVGAVLVFEAGPLELRSGGIDIERVRAYTASRLARSPRAQQRVRELVLGQLPVFVDDPSFHLDYHVRHAALPRPGDERQLKRLAARIFSQALDREKPGWELWFVEGLDDDRFALIAKIDTAWLAGEDGVDPLAELLLDTPDVRIDAAPRREPSPAPGTLSLAAAEVARLARDVAGNADVTATVTAGLRFALNALERAVADPGAGLFTGPGGSHRRIEWLALDPDDLRMMSERLDATPHELLLATLAGALRSFLARRGLEPDALTLRGLTPVGVGLAERTIEAPLVALPVAEPDPLQRLAALRSAPEPDDGPIFLFSLLGDLSRHVVAAASARPARLCVTDLHAPSSPLYFLGARLRVCIPVVPLLPGHNLGIAATVCDGRAMLGFTADAALVPDLPLLADAVAASFDELRRLASGAVHPTAKRADQSRTRNFRAEA